MYPFIYRNKTTGQKVFSHKEIADDNLELIFKVKKVVIDKPIRTTQLKKKL
jgi:hypothetical protein